MTLFAVARQMAVDTVATIPTERYSNATGYFFNGTNESTTPPNWSAGIKDLIYVYPDFLGPIAYLLLFLIPFGMIWMSHGDVRLLTILGFISGIFVFALLPSTWTAAAVIIMGISAAAFVWRMTR